MSMNIYSSPVAIAHRPTSGESSIRLPDSREFASGLTIGQIIKGRVLLEYDNNRYLVAFDGRERVVDSSVPLHAGEMLRGKVTAIGDRVELQRLPDTPPGNVARDAAQVPESGNRSDLAQQPVELDTFLARYQVTIPSEGRALLMRLMRQGEDRNAVMLAAATLGKIGLPQNEALLQALIAALERVPIAETPESGDHDVNMPFGPELTLRLRELLQQALAEPYGVEGSDEGDARTPMNGSTLEQGIPLGDNRTGMSLNANLGNRILNVQGGGSVGHRIGTLPLLVNDRLVEVDVALFDHERGTSSVSEARHRALLFVLNLHDLGLVEVAATVVGNRVRVRIGAERADSATLMCQHAGALREVVAASGWIVDEVLYEVLAPDASNAAARSVVEHVIVQNSVDRLV